MYQDRNVKNGSNSEIPFSKPITHPDAINAVHEALTATGSVLARSYGRRAVEILNSMTGVENIELVTSCTAALEAAIIALNLQPGDEVILPSFTFPSAANAVALRGAVPVWVDIRCDTMNMDEEHLEFIVSAKTKAIIVVHYAGIAAEMDKIMEIANKYAIPVIEDAAQGICSTYKGAHLGSIGTFGALSFHSTKNVHCSKGGALLVNNSGFLNKAKIIINKGTNRHMFDQGLVSAYTWANLGSAFRLNDLSAALLFSNLSTHDVYTNIRKSIWDDYYNAFLQFVSKGISVPTVTEESTHNAHIFYLHVPEENLRARVIRRLSDYGVRAMTHFEPLHLSTMGKEIGKQATDLRVTELKAATLIRLPLWGGMNDDQKNRVIDVTSKVLNEI